MTYVDYVNSGPAQKAAKKYADAFGGRFMGEEPGDRLVYETQDGETAYVPPDGETLETMLQVLLESVEKGMPLIPTCWPELEYDPELVY